jgi:RNA-directed DNA polymerase
MSMSYILVFLRHLDSIIDRGGLRARSATGLQADLLSRFAIYETMLERVCSPSNQSCQLIAATWRTHRSACKPLSDEERDMLAQLKSADTFDRFAAAIGYKSAGLSFILYKIPDSLKYQTFNIPKSSGGTRTIHAPTERLKKLQVRLAKVIHECNVEISEKSALPPISHGFEVGRSIFTNAWVHKNKRHVLNIDIENFFPSINFGRIRGFFISNRDFQLPVKAATLIAQIACFEGILPQGSPCSPIISNLIGHLLDVKLAKMAKVHKCSYSRYADDLTISTNQKEFPKEFAEELCGFPGSWILSDRLLELINRAGFRVNHHKTRMQCRPNRQLVTGLTVNQKVNIRAEYYRKSRKMCSSLFNHGVYYTEVMSAPAPSPGTPAPKLIRSTAKLEGILSHIYHIKHSQAVKSEVAISSKDVKANNKIKYPAYRNLYKKFLYFRHFINIDVPLVMCEGKTDNIYLRSALKVLAPSYPQLADVKNGQLLAKIRFLKHSRTEHDILELSGGSGNIANFIAHYKSAVYNYKFRPMKFPVIVLVDNDSGQFGNGAVFAQVKKLTSVPINFLTKDAFYYLCHNLYLIKTPELGQTGESCMEDLFDAYVRATILEGKAFNPKMIKTPRRNMERWHLLTRWLERI